MRSGSKTKQAVRSILFMLGAMLLPASARVTIMPLGNSITEGDEWDETYRFHVWKRLEAEGMAPHVDFVGTMRGVRRGDPSDEDFDQDHEGHWGYTTRDVDRELYQWLRVNQPDIVMMHLGTNDIYDNFTIAESHGNLDLILDSLRSYSPSVHVLMAQLMPSGSFRNAALYEFNQTLPAWAAANATPTSPIEIVDCFTGFDPFRDLKYDQVHPSRYGQRKLGARFADALVPLLSERLFGIEAALTEPDNAAVVLTGSTTDLCARVDAAGGVDSVEFHANGELVASLPGHGSGLYTAPWTPAASDFYTLRVRVKDGSGFRGCSAPVQVAATSNPGAGEITLDYWCAGGPATLEDFTASHRFPDRPAGSFNLTHLQSPRDTADNYVLRIYGYLHPPVDGRYYLYLNADETAQLWVSADANPENATLLRTAERRDFMVWDQQYRTWPLHWNEGEKHYVEIRHYESDGADQVMLGWHIEQKVTELPIPGSRLSPFGFMGKRRFWPCPGANETPQNVREAWRRSDPVPVDARSVGVYTAGGRCIARYSPPDKLQSADLRKRTAGAVIMRIEGTNGRILHEKTILTR